MEVCPFPTLLPPHTDLSQSCPYLHLPLGLSVLVPTILVGTPRGRSPAIIITNDPCVVSGRSIFRWLILEICGVWMQLPPHTDLSQNCPYLPPPSEEFFLVFQKKISVVSVLLSDHRVLQHRDKTLMNGLPPNLNGMVHTYKRLPFLPLLVEIRVISGSFNSFRHAAEPGSHKVTI
jgi:hypothetical protein